MRPPFERTFRMLSLGQALGFPLGQLVVTFALAFFLGHGEGINGTFLLIALPMVFLITLAVLWGNGGQLIVKATSGALTVTRVRPLWKKERSLPVSMERPTFELRRFGGRSRGFGVLLATEGQQSLVLVDRARVDLLEVLQRDLTAHYASN